MHVDSVYHRLGWLEYLSTTWALAKMLHVLPAFLCRLATPEFGQYRSEGPTLAERVRNGLPRWGIGVGGKFLWV